MACNTAAVAGSAAVVTAAVEVLPVSCLLSGTAVVVAYFSAKQILHRQWLPLYVCVSIKF